MGAVKIYSIEYADGDVEDVDGDEYNVAYELWLRDSGWVPDGVDVKPTPLKNQTKLSKASRAGIALKR